MPEGGVKSRPNLIWKKLRKLGWRILRVWEHELKKDAHAPIKTICDALSH